MRDADPGRGEGGHVSAGQMHAVRAPDIAGQPTPLLEVLDGPAPVELLAVVVFLDGLREVRVQAQPEPPSELG
jgi:hypothetical protein